MGLKVDCLANSTSYGVGAILWVMRVTNHDRLCPVECIGELLNEGPVLARVYFGVEQTRRSFFQKSKRDTGKIWLAQEDLHNRRVGNK